MDLDINSELGRNKEYPTVYVRQSILDSSFLEVYDIDNLYIGRAELVSGNTLNLIEVKQEKNREKRIIKRKGKLNNELLKIEKIENEKIIIPTINRESEFIIDNFENIEDEKIEEIEDFDPLKIFNFN